MKKINRYTVFMALTGLLYLNACQEPEFLAATSFDTLIGEYLEEDSTYSEFAEIIRLTGNMSFLKAYGAYTVFAPTNEAINAYKEKKQVADVSEIDLEELTDLVKYHIILDTLSTVDFVDGKLRTPSIYGQYLLVSTVFEEGHSKSYLNKYAEILNADIRHANGIVHSVKTVLEPITEPIAVLIENDPQFSIFTEALRETGYYDILNKVTPKDEKEKHWYTVFAQTNASLEKAGIKSYEELKAKYSNTGNPSSPEDSLNLYMAYHILDNALYYLGDLAVQQAKETMAPTEVVTIRLVGDSVKLNEDFFNGQLERGAYLIREESDRTSANGVFHALEDNLFIKVRYPFPVLFDVCDQPELRKMVGIFRTYGQSLALSNDQLEGVSWYGDHKIYYECNNAGNLNQGSMIYDDYLSITLRTAVVRWVEFKTPLLVKGSYKVWICTRNVATRRASFTVSFNETTLPNIIDNTIQMPKSPYPTDAELLAMGLKRYNWVEADSAFYYSDKHGRVVSQLAGTIEVPTTGTHQVRFDVINNEMNGIWIDQIHFIPADEDQVWPRIKGNGELVYEYPEGYMPVQK
ncbi:MAG: fasciclin domain-containing protein [Bacteroidales bacterium]|nr:fasciclin domain-containing protein [Bacteroidales bacterium]MDT8430168.1 fasciclin domain-containing protein [Bacteroidales bacterium]